MGYFQVLLRRTEYYANCRRDPLGRIALAVLRTRLHFLGERLGFTIPVNTFGPGLAIVHRGTIVVNEHARIGRNCRIHHGVTIGQLRGQNARIGDNVLIGAGAAIVGGVRVGNGSKIGVNATVVRDVPDGATVTAASSSIIVTGKDSSEFLIDGCAIVGLM